MHTQKEFYTIQEVSERYNISRSSIYLLINNGTFKRLKAGRKTLITSTSVRLWIDGMIEVQEQQSQLSKQAKNSGSILLHSVGGE